MFGLTFEKLLLVGLVAAVIIGPQRLPLVVGHLARVMGGLRRRVDAAQVRAAAELGVPADAPSWRALDPRQYDPRRIIAEAWASPVTAGPSAEASPGAAVVIAPPPVEAPAGGDPEEASLPADDPADAAPSRTGEQAPRDVRRVRGGTSAHPRWILIPDEGSVAPVPASHAHDDGADPGDAPGR